LADNFDYYPSDQCACSVVFGNSQNKKLIYQEKVIACHKFFAKITVTLKGIQ